ncbi:MAG: hypothetical protein ACI9GW_001059 [Halieaceae bacterium]
MAHFSEGLVRSVIWVAVLALCCWVYWPGLSSVSLLDDGVNLQVLGQLEEHPEYLLDVVQGNRSGMLGRSVSMLSFGLEKVYFHHDLFQIKRTNLIIHLLIGSLLAWLCASLFRLSGYQRAKWLGLAVASLWLLSPLFISTVLYTVQRMAQLSMLFVVVALICYVAGRERLVRGERVHWQVFGVVISFGLAMLSKENGAVLVPLIMLAEWWLFRFQAASPAIERLLQRIFTILVCLGAITVLLILSIQPEQIMAGYESRSFSLAERLLTQPRALWHYCTQLLWPNVAVMGVFQDDFVASRGWFDPITTLWSGLGLALLIGITVLKKRAVLFAPIGFGILFFLVAHSVESTFLPLELYFEHRNYLPAVGVYFALVAGLSHTVHIWPLTRKWMLLSYGLLIFSFAYATAYQSEIWSNKFLLYFAAANAHPNSQRANTELAQVFAGEGHIEEALRISAQVTKLAPGWPSRHAMRELLLFCAANKLPTAQAMARFSSDQVNMRDPQTNELFQVLVSRIMNGQCPVLETMNFADRLEELFSADSRPIGTPKIYSMMASLENHLGRPLNAFLYTELLLSKAPLDHKGLQMKLYFANQLGRADELNEARIELQKLDARGELNLEERYNLSLMPEATQGQ